MQYNRFITFFFIGLSPCVEKSLSPSGPTSPSGAASHSIVPHPRLPTEAAARAQRRLCYKQCPAESRSAGCGARRKAVRLSGRRHGVAPWASVKLPLRPAYRSRRVSPSREAQAQAYPEVSQPNPRQRSPSKARAYPWWSTSWSKARQAPAYPEAFPSREAQAPACPEASQPNLRPRSPSKAQVCPWWSTSWSKARQAQAYPWAFPSREAQAQAYPEASRPNLRTRNPSKARGCPAYRHPWANRPVARWRRASFCRAARSSRRGPSQRGRGECATRGGTPRARA